MFLLVSISVNFEEYEFTCYVRLQFESDVIRMCTKMVKVKTCTVIKNKA